MLLCSLANFHPFDKEVHALRGKLWKLPVSPRVLNESGEVSTGVLQFLNPRFQTRGLFLDLFLLYGTLLAENAILLIWNSPEDAILIEPLEPFHQFILPFLYGIDPLLPHFGSNMF